MSFWGELKRRNVVKAGLAYIVVAWLLVQVASIVLPTFAAPPWLTPSITFMLILGFPVLLIFAWAFEITPEGLKKTHRVPLQESITHLTGQKLNYIVTALLAVAVVFLVVDNYVLEDSGRGTRALLPNSVAVLPFDNLSPNEDEAYFAAGIHDEILNQLVKLSGLNVIARTSVMQYASTQKTIPEIASELNVEAIMEGSVRYADGRVLVTTQLIDAATNLHLWADSYERDFANIFAIQADIAMNVANALHAEFSSEEQDSIEQLPTDSIEAYELYLAARAQLDSADMRRALESIDAALALDPEFARAWALKADIHGLRGQAAPADRLAAEQDAMLSAALRAMELEPTLPAARVLSATARGRRGEWIEAERAYRQAYDPQFPETAARYGVHLLAVGDVERAHEVLTIARENDPFSETVRGFYLFGFGLRGDLQRANAEYERATTVFGRQWFGNWFISMIRLGPDNTFSDEIPSFTSFHNDAREYLGSPQEGLAMLRELYTNDDNLGIGALLVVAVWSAHFGDAELALEAMEELTRRNSQNTLNFWIPAMRDVRRLPRFRSFVREIGLVGYWDEFGWPDFCRPLGNEDFECD